METLYNIFGLKSSKIRANNPMEYNDFVLLPTLPIEAYSMKVDRCPTEALSLTNNIILSKQDFENLHRPRHVRVDVGADYYVFTVRVATGGEMKQGLLGFSAAQRKHASVTLGQNVNVYAFQYNPKKDVLYSLILDVDFYQKKQATTEAYKTEEMAMSFQEQFPGISLSVGEPLVMKMPEKKMLIMTVRDMEAMDVAAGGKTVPVRAGELGNNCNITFEKVHDSPINLTGKAKGKQSFKSVISPDWNFGEMGIGGLDDEFSAIFRRAFASRVFPPDVVDQLGMKHCRGILLFGPPGTGKTLMARQIGKMLNSREPKIVNGPQILDKFVGESEANIRKLFQDAEDEEKKLGPNSGLHIIIFDEIDAICKARGSVSGSTAVHDTVVNQLLSKIDGVDQLNNILVIGMTNRKDMIDDALLRPGRLEVQMEIGLPKESGRLQIVNIHTKKMYENGKVADDVSREELAAKTKNFSGAEIEGLCRAAAATAMNRLIKATSKVEVDPDAHEKIKVTRADFMHAIEFDVKPAFGVSVEELERYVNNGIHQWGDPVSYVQMEGALSVTQTKASHDTPLVSMLMAGSPNTGKTALAAQIAKDSEFPFLKICTPETMVGYHEAAKCQAIKKVFADAYKSQLSCIILDDIERLLDYAPIGHRFSNLVLQALLVLLKTLPPKGHKLLILGTTSQAEILRQLGLYSVFTAHVHVSCLTETEHVTNALRSMKAFTNSQITDIGSKLQPRKVRVGIKKLLAIVERTKLVEPSEIVYKFMELLENEGCLNPDHMEL